MTTAKDFIQVLIDDPVLSISDIDFAMKHSADWKRQIELLVRKRVSERLSDVTNSLVSRADAIVDFQASNEQLNDDAHEQPTRQTPR